MRGFTLVELLVVIGLVAVVFAATIPPVDGVIDTWRTAGAARFLAHRFGLTRMQAVHRNANVGLRFRPEGAGFAMRPYADGNANGVLSAEIASGVDPPLGDSERIDYLFPGTRFGFVEGATLIDGTPVGVGADPIRFGPADMATYSPAGSATPGTVYIRGRGRVQFAVTVLGATGRTRISRFDPASGAWEALR